MNLSLLATRALGSTEFFLKKNAPTILTGAGVAGFIATTALTARATVKAMETFPKISKKVSQVKEIEAVGRPAEKERLEKLITVYANSSVELLKIYWPPILTGSASIVCVLAGHNMMLKRQASLVAAYTALDAGFRAYRRRVAEKFGEDKERDLYYGVKTIKREAEGDLPPCEIADPDDIRPSVYARFFDEYNVNWTKTPEYNRMFLQSQQNWANNRLKAHGFVFLNEVYESLGLDRSQAGQMVGWKLNGNGDGFVDFGLFSIGDENSRAFVNGVEGTVLLDFNVDGVIRI